MTPLYFKFATVGLLLDSLTCSHDITWIKKLKKKKKSKYVSLNRENKNWVIVFGCRKSRATNGDNRRP